MDDLCLYTKYYKNGVWINYPNNEQNFDCPFEYNQPFVLEFESKENSYVVTINGKLFKEFTRHMNMDMGKFLHITKGDDSPIYLVEFQQKREY